MLIGLTGPEGAGKSMAGKMLAAHYQLTLMPFAGPLKRMLEAAGVPPANLYGGPADKAQALYVLGGASARTAMQSLGTEWGRALHPDIWVRMWEASVSSETGAIADDVRFQNEAASIRGAGGCIIQIVRSLADLERVPHHASEDFASIPFNFRVVNDKCPTILCDRLIAGLETWRLSVLPRAHAVAAE